MEVLKYDAVVGHVENITVFDQFLMKDTNKNVTKVTGEIVTRELAMD